MVPAPIRRPARQPEKTGSYRTSRSITSPCTCSRGSRAITSEAKDRCPGSAAFNPSARHDGQSGGSRPCCGCEKASALQAPGRYASRTGCCRSAPGFRPLTKCETEVGTAHSAAYSRVCDRPDSATFAGSRIARPRLAPGLALRNLGVLEFVEGQVFRLALDGDEA